MGIINRTAKRIRGGAVVTTDGCEKKYPLRRDGRRRPGTYNANTHSQIMVVGTRRQIKKWVPEEWFEQDPETRVHILMDTVEQALRDMER